MRDQIEALQIQITDLQQQIFQMRVGFRAMADFIGTLQIHVSYFSPSLAHVLAQAEVDFQSEKVAK